MTAPKPGKSLVLYGMTSGVSVRGFIAGQAASLKERGWRVALTCSDDGGVAHFAQEEGIDFLALSFDGHWPQGAVAFHEAFGARE